MAILFSGDAAMDASSAPHSPSQVVKATASYSWKRIGKQALMTMYAFDKRRPICHTAAKMKHGFMLHATPAPAFGMKVGHAMQAAQIR